MLNKRSGPIANRPVTAAATLLLWLATVALGLYCVYAARELAVEAMILGGMERKVIETASLWLLCLLAPAYIAFVVFTGEYHRKILGQPKAMKLFLITIVIEGLIVGASLL